MKKSKYKKKKYNKIFDHPLKKNCIIISVTPLNTKMKYNKHTNKLSRFKARILFRSNSYAQATCQLFKYLIRFSCIGRAISSISISVKMLHSLAF